MIQLHSLIFCSIPSNKKGNLKIRGGVSFGKLQKCLFYLSPVRGRGGSRYLFGWITIYLLPSAPTCIANVPAAQESNPPQSMQPGRQTTSKTSSPKWRFLDHSSVARKDIRKRSCQQGVQWSVARQSHPSGTVSQSFPIDILGGQIKKLPIGLQLVTGSSKVLTQITNRASVWQATARPAMTCSVSGLLFSY